MGHYDSCYEAEEDKQIKEAKKQAKKQLKLMEDFISTIYRNIGADGISARHLENFQDMVNETKLRVSTKG